MADKNYNVFINCPFDTEYEPIFRCIVFAIIHCGFRCRCALEIDDGSQVRIEKIFRIVNQCHYGIHDLSRTEIDKKSKLPRFNMPFELGIFLGAKRFGGPIHRKKNCLILDRESFRYQKFISDISGQDIRAHGLVEKKAISAVRNWLSGSSRRAMPGGNAIHEEYLEFSDELPLICEKLKLSVMELNFYDYTNIVAGWLENELPILK